MATIEELIEALLPSASRRGSEDRPLRRGGRSYRADRANGACLFARHTQGDTLTLSPEKQDPGPQEVRNRDGVPGLGHISKRGIATAEPTPALTTRKMKGRPQAARAGSRPIRRIAL
jgi:hypothetical protein